jgi:tRNA nucleotidyltransferase (CCA-adding enzyme)
MPEAEEGLEAYLVGGAVRDELLGQKVKDRDWVVVGSTPQAMRERGFKPVGRDFPVFLHPRTGEEYALARQERKTAPGYRGFEFDSGPSVTLEQDLARRDLTINAMAMTAEGELVDFFGGRDDLRQGVLRHVSPAFVEDPVRVLRVARFRARYDFKVAAETMALMRSMVQAGEVDALVPERVWQELSGALAEARPSRFVETLRGCGALARVFPEVEALFGVPQRKDYHPEIDSGIHTLLVMDMAARLSDDLAVRFAALVHDLGKALTPLEQLPSHKGHELRGLAPVRMLCERLRVPNACRRLGMLVCRHHLTMHKLLESPPETIVELLEAIDAFRRPERVRQLTQACEADARGRQGREQRPYPQARWLQRCYEAARAVDGAAIARELGDGSSIAEELHRQRCAAVAALDPAD